MNVRASVRLGRNRVNSMRAGYVDMKCACVGRLFKMQRVYLFMISWTPARMISQTLSKSISNSLDLWTLIESLIL